MEVATQNSNILLNLDNELFLKLQSYPTSGLIYHYPMTSTYTSGTVVTDIVSGNDITFGHTVTNIIDHNSSTGGAIQGGDGSIGSEGNSGAHGFVGSDPWTISFWMKPGSEDAGFFELNQEAYGWNISWTKSSSRLYCRFGIDGGTPYYITEDGITTGTWYHITLWKSGNTGKLYIDNSLIGTLTDASISNIYNAPITIGDYNSGDYWDADCGMSQLLMYDRALTETEITQIYQST